MSRTELVKATLERMVIRFRKEIEKDDPKLSDFEKGRTVGYCHAYEFVLNCLGDSKTP